MSIEIIGIDHIYIAVSDLNRSERFYDRMMKHCTFEMRYPPMTKHLSSSSFKACCSILALLMSAASLMDKLVDALFTHVITNDAPGAAVLVAQNGTVLFKKGLRPRRCGP